MKSARAPLLLNLLPCRPCGVERRFRLAKGKFACETCGELLTDETAASAVPFSAAVPDADTRPNPGPESTQAADLPTCAPAPAEDAASSPAPPDHQASAARGFTYGDPGWGDVRPGGRS